MKLYISKLGIRLVKPAEVLSGDDQKPRKVHTEVSIGIVSRILYFMCVTL